MMVSGLLISDKFKILTGANTNQILYTELFDTHSNNNNNNNNTNNNNSINNNSIINVNNNNNNISNERLFRRTNSNSSSCSSDSENSYNTIFYNNNNSNNSNCSKGIIINNNNNNYNNNNCNNTDNCYNSCGLDCNNNNNNSYNDNHDSYNCNNNNYNNDNNNNNNNIIVNNNNDSSSDTDTVDFFSQDMSHHYNMNPESSLLNRVSEKPKAVLVFKNGDVHFQGYHVTLTPRRFRNFDNLLSELTRVTNLPRGARYVFTPTNGTQVNSLDQLNTGHKYVCDSLPKLKKLDYDKILTKGSKTTVVKEPKTVNAFCTQSSNENEEELPPNLRPKVITAIRNGTMRPHPKIKLLLNKRTAHTLPQVLDDVTTAIGSDGCIRRLYNLDGKRVDKLGQLFDDDDVYIAVGSEKFRTCDIPEIKRELGLLPQQGDQSNSSEDSPRDASRKSNSLRRKKVKIKVRYDENQEREVTTNVCYPTDAKSDVKDDVKNDVKPSTLKEKDDRDVTYPVIRVHGSQSKPRMRINSKENDSFRDKKDSFREATATAGIPIVKHYKPEEIFYTKTESKPTLIENVDYFKNKGDIYVRKQGEDGGGEGIGDIGSKGFDKSKFTRYKPLPSIHGTVVHVQPNNKDNINNNDNININNNNNNNNNNSDDQDQNIDQRKRKTKKKQTTSESDNDVTTTAAADDGTVFPVFENEAGNEGLVIEGPEEEENEEDDRITEDESKEDEGSNSPTKVTAHRGVVRRIRYQNKHTIKDIFNDIFNINVRSYSETKHIADDENEEERNEEEEEEEDDEVFSEEVETPRQIVHVEYNDNRDDVKGTSRSSDSDAAKKKLVVNLVVDDTKKNSGEVSVKVNSNNNDNNNNSNNNNNKVRRSEITGIRIEQPVTESDLDIQPEEENIEPSETEDIRETTYQRERRRSSSTINVGVKGTKLAVRKRYKFTNRTSSQKESLNHSPSIELEDDNVLKAIETENYDVTESVTNDVDVDDIGRNFVKENCFEIKPKVVVQSASIIEKKKDDLNLQSARSTEERKDDERIANDHREDIERENTSVIVQHAVNKGRTSEDANGMKQELSTNISKDSEDSRDKEVVLEKEALNKSTKVTVDITTKHRKKDTDHSSLDEGIDDKHTLEDEDEDDSSEEIQEETADETTKYDTGFESEDLAQYANSSVENLNTSVENLNDTDPIISSLTELNTEDLESEQKVVVGSSLQESGSVSVEGLQTDTESGISSIADDSLGDENPEYKEEEKSEESIEEGKSKVLVKGASAEITSVATAESSVQILSAVVGEVMEVGIISKEEDTSLISTDLVTDNDTKHSLTQEDGVKEVEVESTEEEESDEVETSEEEESEESSEEEEVEEEDKKLETKEEVEGKTAESLSLHESKMVVELSPVKLPLPIEMKVGVMEVKDEEKAVVEMKSEEEEETEEDDEETSESESSTEEEEEEEKEEMEMTEAKKESDKDTKLIEAPKPSGTIVLSPKKESLNETDSSNETELIFDDKTDEDLIVQIDDSLLSTMQLFQNERPNNTNDNKTNNNNNSNNNNFHRPGDNDHDSTLPITVEVRQDSLPKKSDDDSDDLTLVSSVVLDTDSQTVSDATIDPSLDPIAENDDSLTPGDDDSLTTTVEGQKTYVVKNKDNENNNNNNENNDNNNINDIVEDTVPINNTDYNTNFNKQPAVESTDTADRDKCISPTEKSINNYDKSPATDKKPDTKTTTKEDNNRLMEKNTINKVFTEHGICAFYDIGEMLGDGNFAVVHRVTDRRTHAPYAMKIIDATKLEGKEELLYNEISIQGECNHPNLVKLYDDFHAPREIFLVMELVRGGDFFDYISENEKLEEMEASIYVRDLCSGIDYLHRRNIVHRDIKPENLLLCTSSIGEVMVKIADFGLARRITGPIYTVCGTPTYVAPEILTERGYGIEVDIWAAGVILYIMLCGFPPFRSTKRQQSELFEIIESGYFEFLAPYWDDISDHAKHLVAMMIVVDKKERFTASEVLGHEWLKKYGLRRTDTGFGEVLKKRTFQTVGKGSLAIDKFSHIASLERGEGDRGQPPPKMRRSRSGGP